MRFKVANYSRLEIRLDTLHIYSVRHTSSCNVHTHTWTRTWRNRRTNGQMAPPPARCRGKHSSWLMSNQENGQNSIEAISVVGVSARVVVSRRWVRKALYNERLLFGIGVLSTEMESSLSTLLIIKCRFVWFWNKRNFNLFAARNAPIYNLYGYMGHLMSSRIVNSK